MTVSGSDPDVVFLVYHGCHWWCIFSGLEFLEAVWVWVRAPLRLRLWGIAGFGQLSIAHIHHNYKPLIIGTFGRTESYQATGVALCTMMSSQNDEDPFLQVQAYVIPRHFRHHY